MNQLNCAHVALPITRVVCYGTATFLVGKNALRATAGYSLYAGSTIAACFDKAALAKNMEANGDLYLDLVKKNAAKDFTKAIAFGLAGYAAEYAGNLVEAKKIASINADQSLVTIISDSIEKSATKLGHAVGISSPSVLEKVSNVVDQVRLDPNPNSMLAQGLSLYGSQCKETVGSVLATGATAVGSGLAYVKAIDFKKVQVSIVEKGNSTLSAAQQWTSDAQEGTVNFLTPTQEKFDAIYNATLEHPIKAATIGAFVVPTGLYATSRVVVETVKSPFYAFRLGKNAIDAIPGLIPLVPGKALTIVKLPYTVPRAMIGMGIGAVGYVAGGVGGAVGYVAGGVGRIGGAVGLPAGAWKGAILTAVTVVALQAYGYTFGVYKS